MYYCYLHPFYCQDAVFYYIFPVCVFVKLFVEKQHRVSCAMIIKKEKR